MRLTREKCGEDAYKKIIEKVFRFPVGSEWFLESRMIIDGERARLRLPLIVESNRVEQLQAISKEDCQSEGVESDILKQIGDESGDGWRECFRQVWDSRYGKTEFAWARNPWVEVPVVEN